MMKVIASRRRKQLVGVLVSCYKNFTHCSRTCSNAPGQTHRNVTKMGTNFVPKSWCSLTRRLKYTLHSCFDLLQAKHILLRNGLVIDVGARDGVVV
jgi:hypothetical protein